MARIVGTQGKQFTKAELRSIRLDSYRRMGREAGRLDALDGNAKQETCPNTCETDCADSYMEGYRDAWEWQVKRNER